AHRLSHEYSLIFPPPGRTGCQMCCAVEEPARRPWVRLLFCHRQRRVRPGVVVRLSTVLDVGLAATICSQRRDLGFEIREALEVAVHAGEPEVSDFVQVAQRRQNRQPDLVAGDLGTARGAELLLDALRQPSQGIFADSAPLAGATHTRDDLLAAERLGRPGTLDRKSTRLNSSHVKISYAVFCLKKKKHNKPTP